MTVPDSQAAEEEEATSGWSLRPRDVIASVVALTTAAIAQPLLDLIGRNATFLVAHDTGSVDVVILAIALPLLLPLMLAGVILLLRQLSRGAAVALHAVLILILAAVFLLVVLQISRVAGATHWAVVFLLALVTGAAVVWGYRRSATFRGVFVVAAVAAPAVTLLFLFASPARTLAFPQPEPAAAAGLNGEEVAPVVFIIFDELPVASLLAQDGTVDADAYPAFARLAEDSTFFRNATTVHGKTSDAIPAAIDGRYPTPTALPIAADHPQNLFALLSGSHDLHVSEALTQLCPAGACSRTGQGPAGERYASLVRDLALVGAHLVLPPDLSDTLPPIDQGWRDFGVQAGTLGKEGAIHERFHAARASHPAEEFDDFVDGIQPSADPTLHFVHVLLPHNPWQFLPDGREYAEEWDWPGLSRGTWVRDDWRVAQTQQRHFLQLGLVDRMLGRLLDRLQATDNYDDAAVVLMADHGASFKPGTSLRTLSQETFGEIAAVPLFIKTPHQREGAISDRPVELVDILPSVLDAIGGRAPAGIEGQSVFDESIPERETKTFFADDGRMTFPADGEEKQEAIERRHNWFRRSDAFAFPYTLAPLGHEDLLGTRVPASSPAEIPGLSVALEDHAAYASVDLDAELLPVYVRGRIQGTLRSPRPALAIGFNGVIAAVTLVEEGSPPAFRAMIPPELLRSGRNDVSVWIIQSYGLVQLPIAGS